MKNGKYSKAEEEVAHVRDLFVEEGLDKATAARYALSAMSEKPDEAFVKDLSGGGLALDDEGNVTIVPPAKKAAASKNAG